jgi:CRP/FNR family transcriptional regulator
MDDRERLTRMLRDCRFFGGLEPNQLAALVDIARLQQASRGRRLFEQDTPCQGLFVVGSGRVKLCRVNPDGKEHILHMADPGQTFAEAAVFGDFDYPVAAEVVDDAELAFLPKGPMLKLMVDHPQMPLKMLASMSQWLRRLVDLMESIVLRDAAGRVAKYLLALRESESADTVRVPIRHQDLAAHLGLTRETISRTLGHLETEGLIQLRPRGEVALTDVDGLATLVER